MPLFSLRTRAIPAILPALCAALSACGQKLPADVRETIEDARRDAQQVTAGLAALPAQCMLGDARDAAGHWLATAHAMPAPGQPYAFVFMFKEPVRTGAFRIALNPDALQHLDKVESRDAQGTWRVAWTGGQAAAPAGCEFVKVAQKIASGEREVAALRVTLRPDKDKMMVADAAALKAD
jgi:hypothetical protein